MKKEQKIINTEKRGLILIIIGMFLLSLTTLTSTINKRNNYNNEEYIQKGLELYKYFVGTGTGPFIKENDEVINYDEVLSKMTDSYRHSFEDNDNGFSIPYKDNGVWKSNGGWGTANESKYKDIKITKVDSCRIYYEITYTYKKIGDTSGKEQEETNEFVVKKNSCDKNDPDTDFSKGYKVDSFKLIYGLIFE